DTRWIVPNLRQCPAPPPLRRVGRPARNRGLRAAAVHVRREEEQLRPQPIGRRDLIAAQGTLSGPGRGTAADRTRRAPGGVSRADVKFPYQAVEDDAGGEGAPLQSVCPACQLRGSPPSRQTASVEPPARVGAPGLR